jgi:pimeloyl-ACP methyl ester carboxylesterase
MTLKELQAQVLEMTLAKLPNPTLLGLLHEAMGRGMKRAGFRFEERRTGENSLGLWRYAYSPTKKSRKRRMVLIPGFGDTPISWLPVVAGLQPTLRNQVDELVLLDFPGFSGFLAHQPAYTEMDALLRVTRDALSDLKPEWVLGHSLGGWIAADYALYSERPESTHSIEELFVIAPSGVFPKDGSRDAWEQMFKRATEQGFKEIRSKLFYREPIWFKLMLSYLNRFPVKPEVAEFVHSIGEKHILTDRISDLKAQVFLIWGEKDELVPHAWHRAWGEALKETGRLRAFGVPGAGHSLHLEKPLLLAALLTQALRGMDPEASKVKLPKRLAKLVDEKMYRGL